MDIFFESLVTFINETRNFNTTENELQLAAKKVSENYFKYKKEKNFWTVMDQNFKKDPELYFLLLSAVYHITNDRECLKKLEQFITRMDIDLFTAEGMQYQIRSNNFRKSQKLEASYAVMRKNNYFLLERLKQEYKIEIPFIPYQERNKKRIIVMSDALLSRRHAPTNIVLELCEKLHIDLGLEVFLIVCIANTNGEKAQKYCVYPYQANFLPQYNGDCLLDTGKIKLPVYQMLFEESTINELKALLQRIYNWKPLCVWYVGGNTVWHDVCCHFITTISMPCVEGYSVSEADVLVSYAKSSGEHIEEQRKYIREQGQKMIDLEPGWVYKKEPGERCRKDYNIPSNAVLLAVVGNRLEDELSEPFLEFMERLVKENDSIYYAIVGDYTKPVDSKILKERMIFFGFCKDLLNVLEITDIFLNPPRQGGGGGAARAQAVGKPVVSLKHCDVEAVSGEEFCCSTLDEMAAIIHRYCTDQEFYKSMSEKSLENYKMHSSIDMKEQYDRVLMAVETWIVEGEIK